MHCSRLKDGKTNWSNVSIRLTKLISDYVNITKADKHYLNITRKSNNRCEQNVRQGVTDNLDQPTRLTYFIPK